MKPLAIYIHIPFCRFRCPYCDFYIQVSHQPTHHADYVTLLEAEIALAPQYFSPRDYRVSSIYFGGGTPSFIDPDLIGRVLGRLRETFSHDAGLEVTLEANPEDIRPEKLQKWADAGVNRLSLGAQGLQDTYLKQLGRQHDFAGLHQALDDIQRSARFATSIDLIFAGPQLELSTWEDQLQCAVALPIQHLSIYGLTIEPGTVFDKQQAKLKLPTEDLFARMYRLTQAYLPSFGFSQYEISNYAKEGHQSQHNLAYWNHQSYWGIGTGAHSFRVEGGPLRWKNPKNTSLYRAVLESTPAQLPAKYVEKLSEIESFSDFLYCGLRKISGIAVTDIARQLDQVLDQAQKSFFESRWDHLVKNNLLEVTPSQHLCIKSDQFILSDAIIAELLDALPSTHSATAIST